MSSRSSRSASSPAAPPRLRPCRRSHSGGSPQAPSPSNSWPITAPRCSPRARRRRRKSLRRAAAGGRSRTIGQRVVGPLGLHPNLVGASTPGKLDLFPERRTSLEVIHQKLGGGERVLAMGGGGDHEHDVLARLDAAVTVDNGDTEQR